VFDLVLLQELERYREVVKRMGQEIANHRNEIAKLKVCILTDFFLVAIIS